MAIEIPAYFFEVRYNGAAHPLADAEGLSRGANCQRFAFALLEHFGFEIAPMRSSELYEDRTFTRMVFDKRALDILMFNRNGKAAHVAVCLGEDRAIHLAKAIRRPVIWNLAEFIEHYRVLVALKRPIRRAVKAENVGGNA